MNMLRRLKRWVNAQPVPERQPSRLEELMEHARQANLRVEFFDSSALTGVKASLQIYREEPVFAEFSALREPEVTFQWAHDKIEEHRAR